MTSTGSGTVIAWKGSIDGPVMRGSYSLVDGQVGFFYVSMSGHEETSPKPAQRTAPSTPPRLGGSCSPAVESTIVGEFNGWDGETIFKLDNGQIWEQAEYDYMYSYSYRPDVTIYETRAGCRMKVEDEEETILVRRIK